MNKVINQIEKLYKSWANEEALSVLPLTASGSNRKYFRITGKEKSAIGVFNQDKKENAAFISFTKHFIKRGLNVPKIFAQQLKENIYLLEDLGDKTLYSLVEKEKGDYKLSEKILGYYKDALSQLIRFQIDGGKGLDYSLCYPRNKFDKQSILWDLNYFKYYFLKLANIPFDEQMLEDDFNSFTKFLLSTDSKYFMYRDFQSRNIMVHNNQLYFIDYQGGRKGALQYDVASLLFQAKINLSSEGRAELLDHYLAELKKCIKITTKDFMKHYYGYVLIRIFQTLGAYGFRGYYENKSHFLLSIPYALNNLQWLVDNNHLLIKLPELNRVLNLILNNDELKKYQPDLYGDKLKVSINSFSYKEGIPKDFSGNGGGFVFDCRALYNPGRKEEFKKLTGLDDEVKIFLEGQSDVKEFLDHIFFVVDKAVANYVKRDFRNLMINFGCTGGQHRSVYCAEKLAKHITEKFDISVTLNHTQLNEMDTL
jgi:aminoglycoside/choline kinase family phosphotransferase